METEAAVVTNEDTGVPAVKEGAEEVAVSPQPSAEKRQNNVDDPGEGEDDPPEKKVRIEEPVGQQDQVMEEPENGNNENADIAVEEPAAAEPEVTAAAESSEATTEEGKVDEVIIPTITESSEGIAEPEASPRASPSPADAAENVEAAVKGPTRSAELNKLWKTVEANPSDFTGWTYLLQHVDGVEVELGREAYDAFLFRYPYCYGYWKKYADLEKKKGSKENCMLVFERGIKAISLSADLWIHYLNHVKVEYADQPEFIRAQYERAVSGCGREWKSDKLWDHYVKWESTISKENVLKLYDRILANQTQGLSHQFDMFREFVKDNAPKDIMSVELFLDMRKQVLESLVKEAKATEVSVDEENQAIRESIIFERKKVFKETEEKVQARWKFEDNIKRPYFHMKSLERSQLKNWSEYLKVESERNSDTSAVEILYERCMIACALYEEFWLKYVEWLEDLKAKASGPDDAEKREDLTDKIRDVYTRACVHHLPSKVEINLSWSAFEEQQGDIDKAADILGNMEKAHPQMLNIMLRRINLERRRANHTQVQTLFKTCIESAATPSLATELSIKYARFLRLTLNDNATALAVLHEAQVKDPKNPKLHLQLLDVHLHQWPLNHTNVMGVFEAALSAATGMPPKHRLLFMQRKLDYLEDFGDSISEVSRTQDAVAKLRVEIKDAETKNSSSESGGGGGSKERSKSRDRDSSTNSGSNISSSSANKSSSSKAVNGTTTYSATSSNSASYGAHHANQYQQYGSRYSGQAGPSPYSSSAGGYSQYGSHYYQGYYQHQ